MRVPSGNISTMSPRARIALAVSIISPSPAPAVDRERTERVQDPRLNRVAEQLFLGDVVHRPPGHRRDHERIQEAAVVGGDDHRAVLGDVLAPDPDVAEVEEEDGWNRIRASA